MLYLLRAHYQKQNERNSSGVHAFIVDAADETEARALALAAAPTGESKPKPAWEAVPLADVPTPIIVQGNVIVPANGEKLRGH
jgi:hypothetical protein